MRYMRIVVVILLFGAVLYAQQAPLELTVDQAVQLALQNSKAHQVSRLEVSSARYRLLGNLGFLPQVTLSGAKNLKEKLMTIVMPSFYPGGDEQTFSLDFTMNYEFTLQVVQPVFTGGKILLNARNAQLDLNIAREKERNSRDETALDVKCRSRLLRSFSRAMLRIDWAFLAFNRILPPVKTS